LTSLCERIESVRVEQRIDETNYRDELELGRFGPGATPEDDAAHYPAGVALATWRGVIEMFAAGMGISLDEVRERREVALAPRDIAVGRSTIPKGRVAGARLRMQGILAGRVVIEIDRQDVYGDEVGRDLGWPQPFPGRERTRHTRIVIEGTPRIDADIDLSASDEAPTLSGMIATAARVTNAIPWVCEAAPGVLTNLDLPGITGAGTIRRGG
jgi:4-hydroxy-tetrahydrodipicolinate reductase